MSDVMTQLMGAGEDATAAADVPQARVQTSAPDASQQAETPAESMDIQALADKYTKKPTVDASEIALLKQQIADLTAKLSGVQQQSPHTEAVPDIFTEDNFSSALENPRLFKQGLSHMIEGAVQKSLESFQKMVLKTTENISANHAQQSAAAMEAKANFKAAFPDLSPYDDFVKMVASSLAPKFEGSANPNEFLNIVGNVARQRLSSMGVPVGSHVSKKPVLPNATPGISQQTTTPTRTVGQSFIESIFGGD